MVTEKEKMVGKSLVPTQILIDKTWIFSAQRLILETNIINQEQFKGFSHFFSKEIENHGEKYFDYDKIECVLYLRSRLSGDFFNPVGVSGRKMIKKYFIDKKIDRNKRDEIPLLAMGSEILWIIGYGINERLLADSNTKNILKVSVTLC
ncbi:tRNA lysidine(34) synthetase TilS [Acetobacterium bakii]|nr:tRNA lysidine(34) synthetase TilS [Acetobacterium bakii]